MTEIKQTISKGKAVDIADTQIYNRDVEVVNYSGNETRNTTKENVRRDDSDYKEITELKNSFNINHLYARGEGDTSNLYISHDSYGDSISVNGYVKDTSRDEYGQFQIYFDSRESVIEFAEKCLDSFAIADEYKNLKKEYKESKLYESYTHPDAMNYYPSLEEKLLIESGRYYWDINKLVEITEDTPEEILDSLWNYQTDENGNFESCYTNQKAEQKLKGFKAGKEINWDSEDYQGINLSNLGTFYIGGYDKGYYHTKVRLESDKRKKKDVTVFVFADRTTKQLDGIWDITDNGVLRTSLYS